MSQFFSDPFTDPSHDSLMTRIRIHFQSGFPITWIEYSISALPRVDLRLPYIWLAYDSLLMVFWWSMKDTERAFLWQKSANVVKNQFKKIPIQSILWFSKRTWEKRRKNRKSIARKATFKFYQIFLGYFLVVYDKLDLKD